MIIDNIINDILEGKSIDRTISKELNESPLTGITHWTAGQLGGLTHGVAGMAKFALTSIVAQKALEMISRGVKRLSSPMIKKEQTDIISQSYGPMLQDIYKMLRPSMITAFQRAQMGEIVDANKLIRDEHAKINQIITAHTDRVFKTLRGDINKYVLNTIKIEIEQSLEQVEQSVPKG